MIPPSSLRDAAWLTSGAAARVLGLLNTDGEEARVVGGAVRNALFGLPVGEIDIATTALPEDVIRRAKLAHIKAVPTGIDHGTVTLVIEGQPFEVTTLREDVETFGRKATVAFGRDWTRDALRRDFTINGLSATPDGVVHDNVGGLADIAARRVRFIGEPSQRIAEDYLRILRFFRIHAAYGEGAPDRAGYLACIAGREGLSGLSAERIRMEMLKLVVAKGAAPALVAMDDAGLLLRLTAGVVFHGAFAAMITAEQELNLEPDPVRRLGALTVAVTEDAKASVAALAALQCRDQAAGFDGAPLVAACGYGRGNRPAQALPAGRGALSRPDHAGVGARGARFYVAVMARTGDAARALDAAGFSAQGCGLHRARDPRRFRAGPCAHAGRGCLACDAVSARCIGAENHRR